MKKISLRGFFLRCVCVVLLSQNAIAAAPTSSTGATNPTKEGTTPAPSTGKQRPDVGNFPTRAQAQKNWDEKEPKSASGSADGPDTSIEPDTGNGARRGASTTRMTSASGHKNQNDGNKITGDTVPDDAAAAIDMTMPMDEKAITKFKDDIYKRSRAQSEIPGGPYSRKPMRRIKLSLAPGSGVETIDVALGMGANITLIDNTGAPVSIASVEGHSEAFRVKVMKTENENIFSIEALKLTGQGGVTIQVNGLPPFMVDVSVGKGKMVDGITQLVVPGVMKSAVARPGARMGEESEIDAPELEGFLAGIPPDGATEVTVTRAPSSRAWLWNKRLYLVTPHTVFTPGYFKRRGAADGTAVYQMPLTPVVNLGVEGREVQAIIDYPYIPTGVVSSGLNTSASAKTK
jgi:intracellular multiplication protein IcmK